MQVYIIGSVHQLEQIIAHLSNQKMSLQISTADGFAMEKSC